eukprot:10194153-Alexandrium_andersonii.AAC.1
MQARSKARVEAVVLEVRAVAVQLDGVDELEARVVVDNEQRVRPKEGPQHLAQGRPTTIDIQERECPAGLLEAC